MNVEVHAKGGCSAEFKADVVFLISQGLSHYQDRLMRVDAHFEDANGPKGGVDHQCRLEVRLAGLQPLAASCAAESSNVALKGALTKMDRLLNSTLGKMKDGNGNTSASGQPT